MLQCDVILDGFDHGIPFSELDIRLIADRYEKEGSSFGKVTLPQLGRALDAGLVTGRFQPPLGWRLTEDTVLPQFCSRVFQNIFEPNGDLKVTASSRYIRFLRQLLSLNGKMWCYPTPSQSTSAWQAFVARQARLATFRIPKGHPVVERAKKLLGLVLRDLDLSVLLPGHGPGAVAERLDQERRWEFDYWPARADRVYPYWMYGIPNELYYDGFNSIKHVKNLSTRVVLVPKDFRGPRLISVEPVANQYLQQGQMRAMYSYVARHKILSKSIDFLDQTKNQEAARWAYSQDAATLDLSDASDNLSATLVWYLLSDLPHLRRQLFATRTPFATFNGERIRLTAFSPMGSAVCFPIETLVFWALSIASVRLTITSESLEYLSEYVRVFGDDIIVPSYTMQPLIGTLQDLGMSPNAHKTCIETPFRESCGTDWWNGESVTIVRNRHLDQRLDVNDVPDAVHLQRNFRLAGLHRLADHVFSLVRQVFPVPSVDTISDAYPEFLIGTADSVGRTRWNSRYHVAEARTLCYSSSSTDWSHTGVGRLLARLLSVQSDRVPRRDLRVCQRWSRYPTLGRVE